MLNNNPISGKFGEESDIEDPEQIERNIKRMLQEEEEQRKKKEEAAKEVPIADVDENAYSVDKEAFENAILKNHNLDGLY